MEYKEKIISLEKNRKLINLCKNAGLECFNPIGEWNGYGYEKLPMAVRIKSIGDMRKYNKIKKELEQCTVVIKKDTNPKESWSKRLSKLTGLDYESCLKIANEKLEYKDEQIWNLYCKQSEHYSSKRERLINKLERSNPLRRIQDEEHARNIIIASKRHNETDYEEKLELIHDLENDFMIEKGNAKEIARNHSLEDIITMRF